MVFLRSLATVWGFALVIPLALLVPFALAAPEADDICLSLFASSEAALSGFDNNVLLEIDVSEKTPEKDLIYTLTWDADCVDPPQITDASFTKYFTVNDTTPCTWEVSVNTILTGVPDYPSPQEKIETQVTFEGLTAISSSSCIVQLTHNILDENTQKPNPDKPEYNLNINEDFPPHYTVSGFQTKVHDQDGTSPDNKFTATTDKNCPLEATGTSYTSGQNAAPVVYQLRESLDFENAEQIECQVTFQDLGNPSFSTNAKITVSVKDVPDEPPQFSEDFYYTEVPPVLAPNDPLPMNPSNISAFDGDTSIDSPITYSMTDVLEDVEGTAYFAINDKTGEVTLVKELDNDFLLNERVLFFVTASDSSQTATALLEVTLPPVPTTTVSTTTSSTTPATTCEPCTCPTYTTETVTECPTCTPCPTDTTTEFTCPVVTCPTTPGECTCEPCPTDTTTEFTCPVVTCPTTPGECTCEPCPTDTTTEFTCPVVTCPTTPSECTCDPCPTDTTTECICPTTPGTEFTTITWGPDMPALTFEQASYAGSIYTENYEVYQVKVVDIGYEVTYDWSENSDGREYFDIDPNTGWITVSKDSTPEVGLYHLEAVATIKIAPSEQATTQVNIYVLPLTADALIIENSVSRSPVPEGKDEVDVATFKLSLPAGKVCIIGADPLSMHEQFSLEMKDDKNWKLKKTGELDYEETQEITLAVEAFYNNDACPEVSDKIPSDMKRSQALVIISVSNKNDEKPAFSMEDLVVAYPTNEGLQKAVGPVVSDQAEDKDSTQVKYSVTGPDAAKFTVDEETGEVYVVKSLDCDPECEFSVTASDGDNDAQLNVKVLPLDMEHVFTLPMTETTVSGVDAKLTQLSEDVGVQISKLYVSPTLPTERRGMRHARDAQVSLDVHVYSIQEGSLISLDVLNSALGEQSTPLQAEEFMDAEVFEATYSGNTEGLTVAVAVLGSLLGIVLIVGIGFIIYKKKKPSGVPKQPQSPTPISTLGNAYQNHSYEKERHVMQGSLGHKTNGSLNGFTSVQVHSTQDGNSPPLHRSPLALPSDNIPLRSMDSQQQQGGLRRTDPSAPEYYGSSTSAPPPYFTRSTGSSSTPEPSTSSSSNPIYAQIKKPKDPKPKSTASASISSSRPEKSVPLSDFSASSIDKKPAVPNSDYEEIGNTKFSSLKASPPPRRSNHHKADDDDDEDLSEGVAYPGGKNAKFADEPAAQDEKKTVAFKVMVDTKEIEAENMGPAQRKAEAEKLMEANRKKLQEEGNEEDEDEEESANL